MATLPGEHDRPRLAFRVAYDGRRFHGFQRQPDVRTVEDTLFEALAEFDIGAGSAPAGYAAAGRTDAGVSALAQTVAFRGPSWLTPEPINNALPEDVHVWARARPDDRFHPRHDATERTYEYLLDVDGLSLRRARRAATSLAGTHDFHNLSGEREDTVRSITRARLEPTDHFLRLQVTAPGFLRAQVRRMASLIAAVGRGDRPVDVVDRVLAPEPLPGPDGIAPAPADRLVLTQVRYPAVRFRVDQTAARAAEAAFQALSLDTVGRGRTLGRIAGGIGAAAHRDQGVDPTDAPDS